MPKIPVFYSFHFDNDVMRVQQVRNMGMIEGNSPVGAPAWETIRTTGGVQKWIDDTMKTRDCVVVLIGSDTASRPWVNYEIETGWNSGKGMLGIHIHNLSCPRGGTCRKGANPFARFKMKDGSSLSQHVACYDPNPMYAYTEIQQNLESWVKTAIAARR